ncbi:Slob family protein kinase [Pelomyxa schiedti]|nr:Slob family protein kinase [Pelomyxa schiedti]
METWVIIVVALTGGLLLVALGVGIVIYCTRRNKSQDMVPLMEYGGSTRRSRNPIVDEEAANSAFMCAQYLVRATANFTVNKPLSNIGSRENKHFFSVRDTAGPSVAMALVPPADNCPYTDAGAIVELLIKLSQQEHPHILKTLHAQYLPQGGFMGVLRRWSNQGSLRDLIHNDSPTASYAKKGKTHHFLQEKVIGRLGRQILEGLIYLRIQGIPYFHLHCGNVIIDDGVAKLTDFENGLLCLDPYHSDAIATLAPHVDPDVVCFGCVLYEMATGYEFPKVDTVCYQLANNKNWNPKIKAVLDKIVNPCTGSPPTLTDLLTLAPFSEAPILFPAPRAKLSFTKKEERIKAQATQTLVKSVQTQSPSRSTSPPLKASKGYAPVRAGKKVKHFSPSDLPEITSAVSASVSPPLSKSSTNPFDAPATSSVSPPLTATVSFTGTTTTTTTTTTATKTGSSTHPSPPPGPTSPTGAPPPPPPPPPPKKAGGAPLPTVTPARSDLLSSIRGFDSKRLHKAS